jgi:hypothetical protein
VSLLLFFFLVVFLAVSSLEFPVVRFLVTCARETLINEWDAPDGLRAVKGYIPWVGQVKRKRAGGNQDSCRRMPVGCGII